MGEEDAKIVAINKYAPTIFPEFYLSTEFYIIVIAGEKYDPEKNIAPAAIVMLNQKFDWHIVARAKKGMDIRPPIRQINDWVIGYFYSNFSPIIPPIIIDKNPSITNAPAFIIEYWEVYCG